MDFAEFYQLNYKGVFRFFYYKGIPKPDCEDLLQEAFTRLYKSYQEVLSDPERCRKILYGISLNLWKNWLQNEKLKKHIPLDETLACEEDTDTNEADAEAGQHYESSAFEQEFAQKISQVKQLITKLNPTVRKVLELRFIDNCTRKQTAQKLNISEDEVHTYQKRGIKYLQANLIVPPSAL